MQSNHRHTKSLSDFLNLQDSSEANLLFGPLSTGRKNRDYPRQQTSFSQQFPILSERNNYIPQFSAFDQSDHSRQVISPKFENSSTCSNIPKSSSDINEDFNMISSERKVLQDIGNRAIVEAFQGFEKPKRPQTNQNKDLLTLNKILQQFHDTLYGIMEKCPEEEVVKYDIYKRVDDKILQILNVQSTVVLDFPSSDKENFDYTDAKAFYSTNTCYLKRAESLKRLPKREEDIVEMNFSEYYHRYLKPMREKVEEYAEKINWLVKEKELEFHNMNEIIQRLIADFSKERQTFEADLLDKNLLIAKLRETIEIGKESNNEKSRGKNSKKNSERADEIDLPRQLPAKNFKSFAPTPEKLYSFRAVSAQRKNRHQNIDGASPGMDSNIRLHTPNSERGIPEKSIGQNTITIGRQPFVNGKQGYQDSSKQIQDLTDLNPDFINISQINFESHETDFSMTNNNLFGDKPTSRFMDFDELPDQGGLLALVGTGNYQHKGRSDPFGQNSKNWAIREEDSMSRQGESVMSTEFDFVKTINESLFSKLIQNDSEKTRLLELVEKLVSDKKEKKDKDQAKKRNLYMQQEQLNKEREQIEAEKSMIEEMKEHLRREKEALVKKKESLKDVIKNIQTKNAKQLAEKDLQLLLMDKKIESKKKILEEEWAKVEAMKREMKNAQEVISNEWKKISAEVRELEKLYSHYEQAKEELANQKKEMKNQYEANLKDIQKGKKELYEEEKRLKNEKRNLQKQQEQFMREKEELIMAEQELQEKVEIFMEKRQDFERERIKRENKFRFDLAFFNN